MYPNETSAGSRRMTRIAQACGSCWRLAALLAGLLAATVAAAPVADTMAERTRACTACHGKEGRATREGFFPRIAGKPAGYLYNQLVNFRDGRRANPACMAEIAERLSAEDVGAIAPGLAAQRVPANAKPAATIAQPLPIRCGSGLEAPAR